MTSRIRLLPWWWLTTCALLAIAFVLALRAGRTIEAVIVGAFLAFELALLGLYLVVWKRGLIEEHKSPPTRPRRRFYGRIRR
jgi:hypothetical protein